MSGWDAVFVVIHHKARTRRGAVTLRARLASDHDGVRFAPRLHERLVDFVLDADVERQSVAETWRSARAEAERLGLSPPGYHSVLRLVRAERDRRAARREVIANALGEPWRFPGPDVVRVARDLDATRKARRRIRR